MRIRKSILVGLVSILVLCMTGCGENNAEIKEAGETIVDNTMSLKTKKVIKVLNEDDDDYDVNADFVDMLFSDVSDEIDMDDVEWEIKKVDVEVSGKKNNKAELTYVIELEGEEYDYVLGLINEDDEWIIEDNKEYFLNTYVLYIEILLNEGDKDVKKDLKEMYKDGDYDDYREMAEDIYEDML